MTQAAHRTIPMKIRDVLLYCAIAVVVAAVAIFIGIYRAKGGLPLGLPVKWLGFAIMTGLIFLNAFRSHRDYWNQRKFWVLMTLFSIFHFVVGFIVVSRLGRVGLISFALVTVLEYFALSGYLDHFLRREE
jgi:hypothetical protein